LVCPAIAKDLLIFLLFGFEVFFAELVHLHELDLIGVLERQIDTLAVYEFTGVSLNFHVLGRNNRKLAPKFFPSEIPFP
jgi:hypothetical protein